MNVGPKVGDLRHVGGEGDRLGSERSSVDAPGSPISFSLAVRRAAALVHSQYDAMQTYIGMISGARVSFVSSYDLNTTRRIQIIALAAFLLTGVTLH